MSVFVTFNEVMQELPSLLPTTSEAIKRKVHADPKERQVEALFPWLLGGSGGGGGGRCDGAGPGGGGALEGPIGAVQHQICPSAHLTQGSHLAR